MYWPGPAPAAVYTQRMQLSWIHFDTTEMQSIWVATSSVIFGRAERF